MPNRTIIELVASHRDLFYPQSWYRDEAFIRTLPNDPGLTAPTRLIKRGSVPLNGRDLPLAVDLVHAYISEPRALIWRDWIWCRDVDHDGQRIFVGGVANGHGFEIHRHLRVTERWGRPDWTVLDRFFEEEGIR